MTADPPANTGRPVLLLMRKACMTRCESCFQECTAGATRQTGPATASGEANHDSTCDVGNRCAYGVDSHRR